jgi:hypothetical protein
MDYGGPAASWKTGKPKTSRALGERSKLTVVTAGQRRQAAPPSCESQRQSLRMVQGGKASTTGD